MSAPPSLRAAVRSVLRRAIEVYREEPEPLAALRNQLDRLDEPLRVAIAGKVKAGKSTLLNAMVGERIAPTDAGECTRVVTWYLDGPTPRVTLHPHEGMAIPLVVKREDGALVIDMRGTPADEVERLVVDWPSQSLRESTLIDTPGMGSTSKETGRRTLRFLTPEDDAPAEADAVIYLMRHLHATDAGFLDAFREQGIGRAGSINAVAVLSRADEVGGGRLDAMFSAKTIARRYQTLPTLGSLVQAVVPVAGLLAETGKTMRHDEFAALRTLAEAPREDVDYILFTADRFVTSDRAPAELSSTVRSALLKRFGLFGIRLSVSLLRQGTDDAATLSDELVRRSGLPELREVLAKRFGERRDVLKARSALVFLDRLLAEDVRPETQPLAAEVERILSGAHEFAELQLLSRFRSKEIEMADEPTKTAERLLGGSGVAVHERLGLPPDSGPDVVRKVTLEALTEWQRRAESPLSPRTVVDASRVVIRSCEGILAALDNAERDED